MKKTLSIIILALIGLSQSSWADEMKPRVRIETNLGNITIELDRKAAPKTVANFLSYVESGYYTGTIFHRVIEGFMIQTGGLTENMDKKPTRDPIVNEADNGLKNKRGTVAMARTNPPHSATSQFFINTGNNTSLNHTGKSSRGWGYCVFGKVVAGMDVVMAIERVPTGVKSGRKDVPISPVTMKNVVVEQVTDSGTTHKDIKQ